AGAVTGPAGNANAAAAGVTRSAELAVLAGQGVVQVLAQAAAVAHVVRTDVAVAHAPGADCVELAARRAAVAVGRVGVVALLVGVDGAVAAAREEDRHRIVAEAGGVDVIAVRADDRRRGVAEAVDARFAVAAEVEEGEIA